MRKTPTAYSESLLRNMPGAFTAGQATAMSRGRSRVARRHFPSRGAHIRQYHRVFLSPYYRSSRTCAPLSRRSRFDEERKREVGRQTMGGRETGRENSISGVHIKVARIVQHVGSQSPEEGTWKRSRIFLLYIHIVERFFFFISISLYPGRAIRLSSSAWAL